MEGGHQHGHSPIFIFNFNHVVPSSKPDYGHSNVGNANNRRVGVGILKLTFADLQYTHLLEKENFNLELCNYQNTYEQNLKIMQVLENTINTHKYDTCTMWYFLSLENKIK